MSGLLVGAAERHAHQVSHEQRPVLRRHLRHQYILDSHATLGQAVQQGFSGRGDRHLLRSPVLAVFAELHQIARHEPTDDLPDGAAIGVCSIRQLGRGQCATLMQCQQGAVLLRSGFCLSGQCFEDGVGASGGDAQQKPRTVLENDGIGERFRSCGANALASSL